MASRLAVYRRQDGTPGVLRVRNAASPAGPLSQPRPPAQSAPAGDRPAAAPAPNAESGEYDGASMFGPRGRGVKGVIPNPDYRPTIPSGPAGQVATESRDWRHPASRELADSGQAFRSGAEPTVSPEARHRIVKDYLGRVHGQYGLGEHLKHLGSGVVDTAKDVLGVGSPPPMLPRDNPHAHAEGAARRFLETGQPSHLIPAWHEQDEMPGKVDWHGILRDLGSAHGFSTPKPLVGRFNPRLRGPAVDTSAAGHAPVRHPSRPAAPGVERMARSAAPARHARVAAFDPTAHPRGKPENRGEFRSKSEIAAGTPAGKVSVGPTPRTATMLGAPKVLAPANAANRAASNPAKHRAVGFVSPETGEGLKLDDAAVRLHSQKQKHFMRFSKEVDRRLGMRTDVDPGIGNWAPEGQEPGAEPTTVTTFRNAPDFDAVLYATAVKAYAANQHAALAFGCDPSGPHRLWSMEVAAEHSGLADVLDAHGIEYRTIRLSNGGKHQVLVLDQDGSVGPKIRRAAESLGVRPAFRSGTGVFIGGQGQDRRQARRKFRSIMRKYERKHPNRPRWDWSR